MYPTAHIAVERCGDLLLVWRPSLEEARCYWLLKQSYQFPIIGKYCHLHFSCTVFPSNVFSLTSHTYRNLPHPFPSCQPQRTLHTPYHPIPNSRTYYFPLQPCTHYPPPQKKIILPHVRTLLQIKTQYFSRARILKHFEMQFSWKCECRVSV